MNFAIYHQELTEMDEREQEERQREQSEQERTPSGHRGNQENVSVNVERLANLISSMEAHIAATLILIHSSFPFYWFAQ